MTQTPAQTNKQPAGERTPIAVGKLIITHTNPHGVNLPAGNEGKTEKMLHRLLAGTEGDIKTEIDFMPWMRSFRVQCSQRTTRTERVNGKDVEVESWKPHKPYFIHETWAVWVPLEAP